MNNIEGLEAGGIKCDNPICGYSDDSVKMEEWGDYVNKPCPNCGENLFTEEDYVKTQNLLSMIELVSGMSDDQLKSILETFGLDANNPMLDKLVNMNFDIHNNQIHIDIENTDDTNN